MFKSYLGVFIVLIAFLLGGAIVWYWQGHEKSISQSVTFDHSCSDLYPYINPNVDCQRNDKMADQIETLQEKVEKIIRGKKENKQIKRASVFYRDLDTKRWFGVDADDEYYPGSLVKLPLAMAYYKMAELRPEVLQSQLVIPKNDTVAGNTDQHYPPQDPLQPETPYAVQEMIRHMLVYSDNTPFDPLMNYGKLFLENVFKDLGIKEVRDGNQIVGWTSSVRSYAAALRALFNVSYLDSASSNTVLSLLVQSTFSQGLASGVPSGVKVAHKFGEGTGTDSSGKILTYTLNDCGIIYKPDQPFILCVMTEGSDFSSMEATIQDITRTVYAVSR